MKLNIYNLHEVAICKIHFRAALSETDERERYLLETDKLEVKSFLISLEDTGCH